MGANETGYLIFVIVAFTCFALAAGIGIVKYRAWRARRGGNTASGQGRNDVPPSYPPPRNKG